MTERWTNETLDRFASTVATAIQASDERMSCMERRFEENNAAISRDVTQLESDGSQFNCYSVILSDFNCINRIFANEFPIGAFIIGSKDMMVTLEEIAEEDLRIFS